MTEGVSVGICDDVLLWREEITDKVLAYQTEKQIQITIKQYSCAEDYLKAQDDIDILFLDIEMSGMSGIALKDILIQNKRKEMIAFITCYDGYIREAFGKNVRGFIDKPVSREKVFEVLDKAVEEKKENAVCDELSGLRISDSRPLYVQDLILCQKIDKGMDGNNQILPIFRECLKPEIKIYFDMTIDESICNYKSQIS